MRPLIAVFLRVFAPAPATGAAHTAVSTALFAVGTGLACYFILSASALVFVVLVATLTLIAAACIIQHPFGMLRGVARAVLVAVHLFWLFQAAALAAMLIWTAPSWLWVVDGGLA